LAGNWLGTRAGLDDMEIFQTHKKLMIREPEGKRPTDRPRHGRQDNIEMYMKEMGYECMVQWKVLVNLVP
jgi:hypothetical protein